MTNDDFLILPGIKGGIGKLAWLTRTGLMICALLSVAELLFLSMSHAAIGVICGMLSSLILNLALTALCLLTLWCHEVLLPERGCTVTRFLGFLALLYSIACPACALYSCFTGKPLLLNQALLPFIVCSLLELIHLINLPNMGAATRALKIRLGLFPVLTMLIFVFDKPGGLFYTGIGKLLLLILLSHPLRQLADIAPRVISMPEKADSARG